MGRCGRWMAGGGLNNALSHGSCAPTSYNELTRALAINNTLSERDREHDRERECGQRSGGGSGGEEGNADQRKRDVVFTPELMLFGGTVWLSTYYPSYADTRRAAGCGLCRD